MREQNPLRSEASDEATFSGPLAASLLVLLALPFGVHAAVVLCSALGAHPLANRTAASAILLLAVGAALLVARRLLRRPRGTTERTADDDLPIVVRVAANALAITAAVFTSLTAIAGVTLPFTAYDALAYRLPLIAQWLDAGAIAWVATDDPVRNGYPMGQEAVAAVVAAACGTLRFESATSFIFIAAGAIALWLMAEHCGVRRVLARAVAALFLLVPMVILNAPSGYVDAAFAGASASLFCCAALLINAPRLDLVLAAATGMAAAHALSIKGTGLAFVAWVGAVCAVHALLRWRKRKPVYGSALVLAGLFALPGSFWTLRNLLRTGNPLWPVQIKLGSHYVLPGVGSMDYILDTAHNTPREYATLGVGARLLRSWFEWRGPAIDFDARMAGLGLAWPLLALPAIALFLVALVRERAASQRRASAPLALVLLLTLGCFALQPMSWWPRYTLWLWGAGALAIGVQAERLVGQGRARALSLCAVALTLIVVGEAALALPHAKDANVAIASVLAGRSRPRELGDVRHAANATGWISPEFWRLGLERDKQVCRGWWKPNTDNPNLDGVFAQLTPRPRIRVYYDDDTNWPRVRSAWQASGCPRLLLFSGSPVLRFAELDPAVLVERASAFDPLFLVRPRHAVALGRSGDLPP